MWWSNNEETIREDAIRDYYLCKYCHISFMLAQNIKTTTEYVHIILKIQTIYCHDFMKFLIYI